MNHPISILVLFSALSLAACDKPTVVNVPADTIAVPGPAGPAGPAGDPGAMGNSGMQGDPGMQGNTGVQGDTGIQGTTGEQGYTGDKGEAGKSEGSTTVVITPPAATPPAN